MVTKKLIFLLKKYESLFYESLGTYDTNPVDLYFKEGAKSVCLITYHMPNSRRIILKNKPLNSTRVLEHANDSRGGQILLHIQIKMAQYDLFQTLEI